MTHDPLSKKIRDVSLSLIKDYRLSRQVLNNIDPPYGLVLNMLCNWVFLVTYAERVFPDVVVDIRQKMNETVRDSKMLLSRFDQILATRLQDKLEAGAIFDRR